MLLTEQSRTRFFVQSFGGALEPEVCISVWPISIDSHFPKRAKRIFYPRPAPRGMRYDTSARRDLTTMNIRKENPPAGLVMDRPPEGKPATGPAWRMRIANPATQI